MSAFTTPTPRDSGAAEGRVAPTTTRAEASASPHGCHHVTCRPSAAGRPARRHPGGVRRGPRRSLATVAAEKASWAREKETWDYETDSWSLAAAAGSSGLHPRPVLREIAAALPEDVVVATDIGNICQIANAYLSFDRPRSMLGAMMFGNCGYAFPTAVGAKFAAPERPVVALVGDGAFGISLNELLTCPRERVGVTVVVFNNGQWGAEKKNHVDFYSERFIGVDLVNPSFAAIAQAFGWRGVRVDRLGDVGPALRAGVEAQRDGIPTLIEVLCTPGLGGPFRRDALQTPVRHLAGYRSRP